MLLGSSQRLGNWQLRPVIPAFAGIHDTVGLVIVKLSSSPVIPAIAGMTGEQFR